MNGYFDAALLCGEAGEFDLHLPRDLGEGCVIVHPAFLEREEHRGKRESYIAGDGYFRRRDRSCRSCGSWRLGGCRLRRLADRRDVGMGVMSCAVPVAPASQE